MMVSPRHYFLPTLLLYHLLTRALAGYVPIRHTIPSKQSECIYEELTDKDIVTFSVFVIEALNNGKPKASITFEGPVAGNTDVIPRKPGHESENNTEDDSEAVGGKMTTGRTIRSSLISDWPKIKGPHSAIGVIERNFKVDWTHAGESEDAAMARAALAQKYHEEIRKYTLENKGKEEHAKAPIPLHTVAQDYIVPYEETQEITAGGWYRLCVKSDFMPLVVEMEMRTADRMKGINPGSGHVYTYEVREYLDERQALFDMEEGREVYDTQDGHRQVRVDDLKEAKIKLKYMHELTSEIMKSQHHRMHRIRAHDADARRGAAELEWSSKLETLLYVMITGFQVYTVHKWLLCNLLGR
mmetsp:Transcript_22083/g.47400  ORF Transcript_22083/g.47400 Transcript_22083/m.47400 type:complete len:356 (+) Transcript_22083:225-1292(+)